MSNRALGRSAAAVCDTDRWFPALRAIPNASCRLFCFPYAGASATVYAPWAASLAGIEIRALQLPGRARRASEPPLTRVIDVVDALMPALSPLLDRPFALFGHSMGAQVAFETARRLQRQGLPVPVHLYVSGRRAPQMPGHDLPPPGASDAEFIETLRELKGTPPEILDDADLMMLLLPSLRADFEVVRGYAYVPGPPLTCPITVFGGADDEENTAAFVHGWAQHTTHRCEVREFPGDHFFVHTAAESVLAALATSLRAAMSAAVGRWGHGHIDG